MIAICVDEADWGKYCEYMLIILFFKFLSIFLSKVVPGFRFDVFRYFFGHFSIVHDNYILKLF